MAQRAIRYRKLIITFESTDTNLSLRIGRGGRIGPPLSKDEVCPDAPVGFDGPVLTIERSRRVPVAAFPEAPEDYAFHRRVAEHSRKKIPRVGCLQGLFLRRELVALTLTAEAYIEFGDQDGAMKDRESAQNGPEPARLGECLRREMPHYPNAIKRIFVIGQVAKHLVDRPSVMVTHLVVKKE